MNIIKTPLTIILGLSVSCVHSGDTLEFDQKSMSEFGNQSIEVKTPGKVRLYARATQNGFRCKARSKKKSKPKTSISLFKESFATATLLGDSQEIKIQGRCQPGSSLYEFRFPHIQFTGSYKIEFQHLPYGFGRPKVVARFSPKTPELNSGADQMYLGATKVEEGVHEGELSTAEGDSTDWWVFKPKQSGKYDFVFQHNGRKKGLFVSAFKLKNRRLVKVKTMSATSPWTTHVNEPIYLKFKSAAYVPSLKYSVILQPNSSGRHVAKQVQVARKSIDVLDFHTKEGNSLVTLGAGLKHGLAKGQFVTIVNSTANGKEIDSCEIQASTSDQSLCRINAELIVSAKYKAKRVKL